MKSFVLLNLYAQNYKNIKRVNVDFDPETNMFIAPNGFGKSTLASMITDVLFGRNIKGEAIYNRIPRDGEGNLIYFDSKLKNETQRIYVKLLTLIDGKKYELMKEYTNEGRLKTYYVGETKYTKKHFEEFVKQNISELDIFKLCTDVWYFTKDLNKDKQERAIKEVIELPSDLEMFKILMANGYESTPEFTEELLGNPDKLKPPKQLEDIFDKYSNQLDNAKVEINKRNIAIETTEESIKEFESEVEETDTTAIKAALTVIEEQIVNLKEEQKGSDNNRKKRKSVQDLINELEAKKILLESRAKINPYDDKVKELENDFTLLSSRKTTRSKEFGLAADKEVQLKKIELTMEYSNECGVYEKEYTSLLDNNQEQKESQRLVELRDAYETLKSKAPTKEEFDFSKISQTENCILCGNENKLSDVEFEHNKNQAFKKASTEYDINLDQAKRNYEALLEIESSSHTTNLENAFKLWENQKKIDEQSFNNKVDSHNIKLKEISDELDEIQSDFSGIKIDIESTLKDLGKTKELQKSYTGETSDIKKLDLDIEESKKNLAAIPEEKELPSLSDLVEKEQQLKNRLGNEITIATLQDQRSKYEKEIVNYTKELELAENVLLDSRRFVDEQFNIVNIEVAKDLPTIRIRTVEPKADTYGFKRVFKILKDGKEYGELSDGEQLAVALELLNFFNKKHNVKLPIISDALETITSEIKFNNIQALIFKADSKGYDDLQQYNNVVKGLKVAVEYFNQPIIKKEIVYDFKGGE